MAALIFIPGQHAFAEPKSEAIPELGTNGYSLIPKKTVKYDTQNGEVLVSSGVIETRQGMVDENPISQNQ